MAFLIGLDEAGYGPTLGPLVVAATSFRFEEAGSPDPGDLWTLLSRSVTRQPRRGDRRIPIADSKVIFSPHKGLSNLEEAVLAATLASRPVPTASLPGLLGLDAVEEDSQYPWYRHSSCRLPIEGDLLRIRPRSDRLAADLDRQGGAYLGAHVLSIEAGEFNQGLVGEGNKSVVLFAAWSRLLRRCLDSVRDEPVRVMADRHGGRKSYLPLLRRYLDDLEPRRVREEVERSEYTLAGGRVRIVFQVRAETESLPVALASMIAKYVREVRMGLFNRFWASRIEDLRPTSGYPVDARRFLSDIRPSLRALRIPRARLVRGS